MHPRRQVLAAERGADGEGAADGDTLRIARHAWCALLPKKIDGVGNSFSRNPDAPTRTQKPVH